MIILFNDVQMQTERAFCGNLLLIKMQRYSNKTVSSDCLKEVTLEIASGIKLFRQRMKANEEVEGVLDEYFYLIR